MTEKIAGARTSTILNANPGLRSENYAGKKHGMESSLTGIELPMIIAVEFVFLNVINGKEGAENNNACGNDTVGKESNDLALGRIRKLVGQCNGMHGFLIFRSSGGIEAGFRLLLQGFC
jgi:hypothetical protein